jgi:integrase/recombinase XerD
MIIPMRQPWTPEAERNYILRLIAGAPAAARSALSSFARWLEQDRGRALGTIVRHVYSARCFVAQLCARRRISAAKALRVVTAVEVEDFFVDYSKKNGPGARRNMQAALRSFLRFARSRGWVDEGVATAVPSVRRYRLAGLPRAMPEADLMGLLSTIGTDRVSLRDRAIIWLLACYGVRRGQVSALLLGDINWRSRTILFRPYKRGKAVEFRLLSVISDALVRYLRFERPLHSDNFVFVRKPAPHWRLSPEQIGDVVRRCMRCAGLEARGPHSLRHAFACRQLRNGGSLKTIADLLGHRSLGSVAIYAKVDHPRLLEAAVEWPEVRS